MACFELTNDDFDDMHHALGRPKNVFASSYRNFFCADVGSPSAERLSSVADATGFWRESRRINNGRSIIFEVTDIGRDALADWLKINNK